MKLTLVGKTVLLYVITLTMALAAIGATIVLFMNNHGRGAVYALMGSFVTIVANVIVENVLYPAACEIEKKSKH